MEFADLKARLEGIASRAAAAVPAGTQGETAVSQTPLAAATTDHASVGVDLDATVPPERVADAASMCGEAGFTLEAVTGVDWIAEQQVELVYDYANYESGKRLAVRVRVPREKPELPTVSAIHPGANWHERETHDFFGVVFTGHPDLTPFLLPEDADFHPLRKDFKT